MRTPCALGRERHISLSDEGVLAFNTTGLGLRTTIAPPSRGIGIGRGGYRTRRNKVAKTARQHD